MIDLHSMAAVSSLATLYLYGFGVPQSYSEARRLLQSAARGGAPQAQNKLGTMYESGVAVRRNLTRAKDLYLRSALQPNLGLLYIEALGVSGEPSPAYIRSGNVDQNTLSAPWSPGFRYSSEW